MAPSRRLARLALALASALTLTGCAAMITHSYLAPGADLGRYHTYALEPEDRFETGDPRLDNNTFFQARIQAAVEKELAARGYEKTASDAPELVVHCHASVRERIDVNGTDQIDGYCDSCTAFVYEAGTIVLDFVDTKTNKLVWRGWTEDTVGDIIDRQDLMEARVDEAVARIIEKLPRRL